MVKFLICKEKPLTNHREKKMTFQKQKKSKGHEQKNHTKIQISNKPMNIDFNFIKNQRMQMKTRYNVKRNAD